MGLFSRKADVPELTAKRDLEGLAKALKDDETRAEAAEALVSLRDPASVPPLLGVRGKVFTGLDSNNAASETLRRLGPELVVTPLMRCLDDQEHIGPGTETLVEFGADAGLEPLLELRRNSSYAVAKWAFRGLMKLGTPRAIEGVAQSMEQGPHRREAFIAVKEEWKGGEEQVVRAAVSMFRGKPEDLDEQLVEYGSDILDDLIKRSRDGEVDGDALVPVYLDLLKDPVDQVRLMGATMLDNSVKTADGPDPRFADALHAACEDSYDRVRSLAARSLARQHDPRAVPYLMRQLDEDRDDVVEAAGQAIAMLAQRDELPEKESEEVLARFDREKVTSKVAQSLAKAVRIIRKQDRQEATA